MAALYEYLATATIRRQIDNVRQASGLDLPKDIVLVVNDEDSNAIPADGSGVLVFTLRGQEDMIEAIGCDKAGYVRRPFSLEGIHLVMAEPYFEPTRDSCYRYTKEGDGFSLFLMQGNKLLYAYMW